MNRTVVAGALIAAFTFLATGAARADAQKGLYLGAGVGQFNVEVDNLDEAQDVVNNFDSDDTTFKVFGGWRFTPVIAVELDYIDLGAPEDTIAGTKVQAKINGVAPYLVATLPLGIFEIFGKVGYYFYDVEFDVGNLDVEDRSSDDFAYGAGVGLTFFEHLNARLEYEFIDISDADTSNALWLTGAWRF